MKKLFLAQHDRFLNSRAYLARLSPVLVIFILSSFSTALSSPAHSDLATSPANTRSDQISVPMHFMLQSAEKLDLRNYSGRVDDDRIKQFVLIGIKDLSRRYGIDATSWKIDVTKIVIASPMTSVKAANGKRSNHYVTATAISGLSNALTLDGATDDQKTLLETDKRLNDDFDYIVQFRGDIRMEVFDEQPHSIYFDVNVNVSLLRKAHRADAKHFDSFDSISQRKIDSFRKTLRQQIFTAYVDSLKRYGFQVRRSHE